jgi:hypothetical protein
VYALFVIKGPFNEDDVGSTVQTPEWWWLHRHRGMQHVIDTRIIYFTVYVLVVVGRRSSPGRRVCGVPEVVAESCGRDRLKVRSGATATEHYCTHKPDTRRLITMVRTIKV